jgi:hypothetical protein
MTVYYMESRLLRVGGRGELMVGRRCLFFLAFSGIALTSANAIARRRGGVRFSGRGLSGSGAYRPGILTQSDLERCLLMERNINRAADSIERQESILRTTYVDQYSAHSVNSYNMRVSALNSAIDGYNQSVDDFNQLCANKQYYENDMNAVRARIGY